MSDPALDKLFKQLDQQRGESRIAELALDALLDDGFPLKTDHMRAVADQLGLEFRGLHLTPRPLCDFISRLVADRAPQRIIDPTCGTGSLLLQLAEQFPDVQCEGVEADCRISQIASRLLGSRGNVECRNILDQDAAPSPVYDLIVADAPLGARIPTRGKTSGWSPAITRDLSDFLAQWAVASLTAAGIAILVMPGRFVWSRSGVALRAALNDLGGKVSAYIHLPPGTLSARNIDAYLCLLERGAQEDVFIGQYTPDEEHQKQLMRNLRNRRAKGMTAQGRLIPCDSLLSYPAIEAKERYARAARSSGHSAVPMSSVVLDTRRLRRDRNQDEYEEQPNSLYLQTAGFRPPVTAFDQIEKGHQNWIELNLNPDLVDASYLAHLLTTPQGKLFLGQVSSGTSLRNLTISSLLGLDIYLPSLDDQQRVLQAYRRLSSIKASIDELVKELWETPSALAEIERQVEVISTEERYDDWLETLPFTLASILWRHRTSTRSARERYEVLLHFFEAAAEFLGTIHLSAFSSEATLWAKLGDELRNLLGRHNLSLERSTFGSWKCVSEFLSNRCRGLLDSEPELCQTLYRTRDQVTISCLSDKRIIEVLGQANGIRNNFHGHTGAISDRVAESVHAELEGLVSRLREVWGRQWSRYELIKPGSMEFSEDVFRHDLRRLSGTRTPFVSVRRDCIEPLDKAYLYLLDPDADRGLKLLPFVRMAAAPEGEATACYFYSKQDKGKSRFVSYHFEGSAEITEDADFTSRVLESLHLSSDKGDS